MEEEGEIVPITESQRFNAIDADVTLRSRDRVHFRVHRKNLEVHSEGFAGAQGFSTKDEVVYLTETSAVLDLLLRFIYPQPPPNLTLLGIELLVELAEAAEKYLFHGVIQTCRLCMRPLVGRYPFEILKYASRHNNWELMDPAAENVLKMEVLPLDGQPCEIPGWFYYTNSRIQIMKEICKLKDPLEHLGKRGAGSVVDCDEWPKVYALITSKICGQPSALSDITSIIPGMDNASECATCRANLDHWRFRAEILCEECRPLSFYAKRCWVGAAC